MTTTRNHWTKAHSQNAVRKKRRLRIEAGLTADEAIVKEYEQAMNQLPLTHTEARAEFNYRLHERIGMMTDGDPPTEEQVQAATAETMREIRLVKNYALHPPCLPSRR